MLSVLALLAGSAIWRPGRLTRPGHWGPPGCPVLALHSSSVSESVLYSQWASEHTPVTPQWPLIAPSDNRDSRQRTWGWSPHPPWPWPWSPWRSGWTRPPTWWVTSRSLSRVWSKQRKSASRAQHWVSQQGRAGPGIDCWAGSPPPLPAHSHLYHTYKPWSLS